MTKYQANRDAIAKRQKQRYQANKDAVAEKYKQYYQDNKESIAEKQKQYYQDNKEIVAERNRQYVKNNAKATAKRMKQYAKDRRANDPVFRMIQSLRSRLRQALKNTSKNETTIDLVGCSPDFLRCHLSAQFTEGMTLENYGEWHIDHIRPVASFDQSDRKQRKVCWHYTNLQPLWAEDNLKKSDTW